jgi:hypothetical protein
VQLLPSLHGAVLKVCTHPSAGTQLSVVHGLLSSEQRVGAPPTQTPAVQVSDAVHPLPSSHGAALKV